MLSPPISPALAGAFPHTNHRPTSFPPAQVFDTSVGATKATDEAAADAINAAAKAEAGSGGGDEYIYSPVASAKYTTGVAALEWTRDGVTVLVFRGSTSKGDYGNVENWFLDYILERSTARMKQAWTEDAGLTWTDMMQDRQNSGDLLARTAIRTLSFYSDGTPSAGTFAPTLADTVSEEPSLASLELDEAAARATGYWPLTKRMVS